MPPWRDTAFSRPYSSMLRRNRKISRKFDLPAALAPMTMFRGRRSTSRTSKLLKLETEIFLMAIPGNSISAHPATILADGDPRHPHQRRLRRLSLHGRGAAAASRGADVLPRLPRGVGAADAGEWPRGDLRAEAEGRRSGADHAGGSLRRAPERPDRARGGVVGGASGDRGVGLRSPPSGRIGSGGDRWHCRSAG